MRRAPLIPVAIVLMGAMLTAHLVSSLTSTFWLTLTSVACLLGGIAMLWLRKTQSLVILCLLFFTAGIGGWLMRSTDPVYDSRHWTHLVGDSAYLDVRLTETPLPRERSYRATARVYTLDGTPCRGDITLFLRKDSVAATLRYGDRLLIHAYPNPAHRSLYTTADHYILTARDSTSLHAFSERLRMKLLGRLTSGPLTPQHAGIAAALTLGWRGDLDSHTANLYRDSGIIHLLCVSGLHVGLLASLVGILLFWLGKERRGRLVRGSAQLLAVWLFVPVSGAAPATLRAALMFSLFIIANILGRRTDRLNLLAFAAIAMLVAKPLLLFDLGWQLSFSAVTGILLVQPLLRHSVKPLRYAIASTSATVATLPLIVSRFHRLPLYFLIANLLIVPLAGIMLALSLLYLAIPGTLTAWPLDLLMSFSDTVTSWVASLPLSVIGDIQPTPWHLAALTVAAALLLLSPRLLYSKAPRP